MISTFFLLSLSGAEEREASLSELKREEEAIRHRLEELPRWIPSAQSHGRIGFYGQPRSVQWIVVDLGRTVTPEEVVLFPARLPVDAGGEGSDGFPPEIEVEIAADDSFADAVRIGRWEEPVPSRRGDGYSESEVSPPFLRFPASGTGGVAGRYLRLRIFGDRARPSGRGNFYTLGEIMVFAEGRNAALGRPVETSGGIENVPRWQAENLTDGYLWCLPGRGRKEAEWNGFHSGIEKEADRRKWVELVLPEAIAVDEVHLVPAHPRDFADTAGFGFPRKFRVLGSEESGIETVLLDSGAEAFPNPGAANLMIPVEGRTLTRVRVECRELWQRTGDYLFALSELQVWSQGRNVAAGAPVTTGDEVETGTWRTQSLTDGGSSRWELLSMQDWLNGLEERGLLERRLDRVERALVGKSMEARRVFLFSISLLAVALFSFLVALLVMQKRRALASREALRERIAHDLHDELGASLSHLALESDLARRALSEDDPVRERLSGISESARDTLDHMRDVIWLLAPATDSWEGFQRRIESISDRILAGMEHRVSQQGTPPPGRPPIAWTREWVLFFKEALTNARRHANASRIDVELIWEPKALQLAVRDNGRGFDPGDPALATGLGLKTYRRRSRALGGSYQIKPNPGGGVTVHLRAAFPKKETGV